MSCEPLLLPPQVAIVADPPVGIQASHPISTFAEEITVHHRILTLCKIYQVPVNREILT
jgi:hypothetical protein